MQTAIRETLVLPNCESVCIPWMIAEKDDWVPQKVAPFMWNNHESVTDPTIVPEVASSQPGEVTPMTNAISSSCRESVSEFREIKDDREQKVEGTWGPIGESCDARASSDLATTSTSSSRSSLQDLSTPLLRNEEPQQTFVDGGKEENPECQPPTRSLILTGEQMEGDDGYRQRRMGTRARMLGLGKKMGEKLEEKRRHIEKKGRTIVERMRAP